MPMKNLYRLFINGSLSLLCGSALAQGTLTSGNLVVLQAGDGTAALANTGNALFLKEYTKTIAPQAAPVSILAVPTTGAARLVISGSAATEGLLTLSADSSHLVLAGYDTSLLNAVALPGSSSAAINRAVDTVGLSGNFGRAATTTAFTGNNIRAAVKGAGNDYWAVGGNGGVQYLGNSNAATALGTTVTNIRALQIASGNLYFSSASGANTGISKITGMPTASGTGVGALLFGTGANSQPADFAVDATETIVYVADSRANANGGIYKWVLSGGTWAVADTLAVGAGARGLAVDWSTAFPTLYATTTDNRLVAVIDSNYAAGYVNSYVTIDTAPTGAAFRGLSFTPKSATGGCTAPTLSPTVTDATCTTTGSIALTATGGSTIVSYSWVGAGGFSANTQNISNLAAGSYLVTVTTVGGCTATATAVVSSIAPITATATAAGPTSFCQGGSVVLNANTGAGYTYQWFDGPTAIPSATSASYTATSSGAYSVQVTSGSCTVASMAVAVNVGAPLNALITAGGPATFCQGDSVRLQTASTAGLTYQWYLNGTAVSGASDSILTASSGGNYRVVVSNGSCTDTSAAFTVVVHPKPMATITAATDTTFCQGDSVTLNATAGAGWNYRWALGGTAIPGATSNTYTARISGNYRVLVVTAAGCADTAGPIHVEVKPLPMVMASYTNGQLTVQNSGMYTNFQWYLNGGTTPVSTSATFIPAANGSYVLHADSNGCTGISNAVAVTGLSVSAISRNPFTVYPNPATTAFEILPVGTYHVRIADVQGRTVLQTETTSGVDISLLANGLYVLFVREAGGSIETPVRLIKK